MDELEKLPAAWNIFRHIRFHGSDDGFEPSAPAPTAARPGTRMKYVVLQARVLLGQELWHPEDPVDYENYTAESGIGKLVVNQSGRKRKPTEV
jgi:hypothetical protein